MKLASIYLFLCFLIAFVASAPGPNFQRLARGLPPLPPKQFANLKSSRVESEPHPSVHFGINILITSTAAKRSSTSSPSNSCSTGSALCCDEEGTSSNETVATLLALLGIVVTNPNELIGVTCSPITGSSTWYVHNASTNFTPLNPSFIYAVLGTGFAAKIMTSVVYSPSTAHLVRYLPYSFYSFTI
jgi:hypothetical protein